MTMPRVKGSKIWIVAFKTPEGKNVFIQSYSDEDLARNHVQNVRSYATTEEEKSIHCFPDVVA